jgi:Glycosyl transferase family 11
VTIEIMGGGYCNDTRGGYTVIAATLVGGLGNQLFQYAAGRSLALRHDTELVLDLSLLRGPQSELATPRAYELGCFQVEARTVESVRSWESLPAASGAGLRTRSRIRRARARFTVLRQRGFELQPAFFGAPDDTLLVGFWQSEAYFADQAERLRRDLVLPAPAPAAAELLARVASDASVSVHVRRGDYAHDAATRRVHGLLPEAYHRAALEEIAGRTGTALDVHVFSDEPAWCREHLDLGLPFTVVDLAGAPAYEELRAMSACRHHVVANSSFSWWGAWLDARPDAIVVAPRQWVADTSIDTAHVVPERWIRLDAAG